MKVKFPYTEELLILNKIFNENNNDNLRIVGGAVRNFLLSKKINDFDLSTKLSPDESIELLKKNEIKAIPTGINFGTITAVIKEKTFEITTTRKDIKTDGRHASVEFTRDFEIDAKRRDFTFNALYLDFNGNIYDYFNGISDLKKGIVRFIGNPEERIKEDYLRILRFFRFYCYYATILDNEGLKFSIEYKKNLSKLSGERIKAEMFKILIADYPIKTLKIMQQNDILQIITNLENFNFKELEILFSIKKFINYEINAEVVLSLLINNVDELNILKERWKLSKKENKKIFKVIEYKFKDIITEKDIKNILFNGESKDELIDIIIVNSIANYNKINNTENIVDYINKMINFIKITNIPVFPINGEDLKKLNFFQKKDFTKILNEGKEIFINSNYDLSKEKIIEYLKKYNNFK